MRNGTGDQTREYARLRFRVLYRSEKRSTDIKISGTLEGIKGGTRNRPCSRLPSPRTTRTTSSDGWVRDGKKSRTVFVGGSLSGGQQRF